MSKSTVTLLYLGSNFIVGYVDRHPIDWASKELAIRGGIGDRAGMPPTPMVYEFFSLVAQKQGLFTQQEFCEHCFEQWYRWDSLNNKMLRAGVKAKLYRNVYPAMMNTLHAWALLVEAAWFDICVIDTLTDAISKHDLIIYRDGFPPIALDIFIQTEQSVSDRAYKQSHRKSTRDFACEAFAVPLPLSRQKRRPGNMRWYCLRDFEHIYMKVLRRDSLWNVPAIPCTCGCHVKGTVNV